MTNKPMPTSDEALLAKLSDANLERYARHLVLPKIGPAGQQRLLSSRVAIVGIGGIGCPVAQSLVAAGVGHLTLIDDDRIALSNLNRQILFSETEIGTLKVEAAARALAHLNPQSSYAVVAQKITDQNAQKLLANHDLIIDGTDTYGSRCVISAATHRLGQALISASVLGVEGQVAIFAQSPKRQYTDLFPITTNGQETCAEVGVFSSATSMVASVAACVAITGIVKGSFDGFDGQCALVNCWPPSIYWLS